jgi:hypothetical protein
MNKAKRTRLDSLDNLCFCHWNFSDPLREVFSSDLQKRAFEKVFRQLLLHLSVFVALPIESMKPSGRVVMINKMD